MDGLRVKFDFSGARVLVTGGSNGIGLGIATAFAESGAEVTITGRRGSAAEYDHDLSAFSFESLDVRESAALDALAASQDRLDVLVNNAGLMATPEQRTTQGFEMQFGVNHLGPMALTAPLLPRLLSTEGSRVVAISSNGHKMGRIAFDDLMGREKYSAWRAYFQSKLANLLFTRELQRRLGDAGASTVAVAAHPGGSHTNLGRESAGGVLGALTSGLLPVVGRVLNQSAAMGALPTLRAAVGEGVKGGDYFGPGGLGELRGHPVAVGQTKWAQNVDDARRLWDVSVELTEADYSVLDSPADP
jgi:NAD(P)-dependent dehydrogenase (short-subunit alcohol dehydrogenase family)